MTTQPPTPDPLAERAMALERRLYDINTEQVAHALSFALFDNHVTERVTSAIEEAAPLLEEMVAALAARDRRIVAMTEAFEEVDAGLQSWLESYGDYGGHIVGLLSQIHATQKVEPQP